MDRDCKDHGLSLSSWVTYWFTLKFVMQRFPAMCYVKIFFQLRQTCLSVIVIKVSSGHSSALWLHVLCFCRCWRMWFNPQHLHWAKCCMLQWSGKFSLRVWGRIRSQHGQQNMFRLDGLWSMVVITMAATRVWNIFCSWVPSKVYCLPWTVACYVFHKFVS